MRYYLTSVRIAISYTSTKSKCQQELREKGTLVHCGEIQIGAATMENSVELPQKINNGTALRPTDSTFGNESEET